MSTQTSWKSAAKWLFQERAEVVAREITQANLCYVSGREQRLWSDPLLYEDLMESIQEQLDLTQTCSLLEVGCAAGFLARGLANMVARYTGVDVARKPLEIARKLGIPNADFLVADGTRLPWPEGAFDRTICYDVFTNFPDFSFVAQVIRDMVRVTRRGGKIMAGSLADEEVKEAYIKRVETLMAELDRKYGPVKPVPENLPLASRLRSWFIKKIMRIDEPVVCYYFRRSDFLQLGDELGLQTQLLDIHRGNPYRGYRFNVIYTKPR